MVKSEIGSETTYYPHSHNPLVGQAGSHYERRVVGTTTTNYKNYFAGSVRIAMRVGDDVTRFISDHLGSTSVTTTNGGNLISSMRYSASRSLRPRAKREGEIGQIRDR